MGAKQLVLTDDELRGLIEAIDGWAGELVGMADLTEPQKAAREKLVLALYGPMPDKRPL